MAAILEEKAVAEKESQDKVEQANTLVEQKQSLIADLQESIARNREKDGARGGGGGGGVVKKVEKQVDEEMRKSVKASAADASQTAESLDIAPGLPGMISAG